MVKRTRRSGGAVCSDATRKRFVSAAMKNAAEKRGVQRDDYEDADSCLRESFRRLFESTRSRRLSSGSVDLENFLQQELEKIRRHEGVRWVEIRAGTKPRVRISTKAYLSDQDADVRIDIGELQIDLFPDGRELGHRVNNLTRKGTRPVKGMQTPYVGPQGEVLNTNVLTPLPSLLGKLELYQAFKLILQAITRYDAGHPWNTFLIDWNKT